MKTIKVLHMHLRNFKGIKEFGFSTNGQSVEIYGDNAAGKTTIFDAFAWVLFGKNSQNQAKFNVKTLDENGDEMHRLEHEVELHLDVDGTKVQLKRVLFESWKVKNGTTESSFTNSTKYYIDDVPIKTQKEYDAFINTLVDEEEFKLLTSPTYFNVALKWEDRRKRLLEVCGDVSDEEVIASNLELKDLPMLLNGKTAEQRKAQIVEQKKAYKAEINDIPSRADELSRQIPETVPNIEGERQLIEKLTNDIDKLRTQKNTVISGAALTKKEADLRVIDSEITSYTQQFKAATGHEVTTLQVQLQEKQANISIAQSRIKQLESEIGSKEYMIQQSQQLLQDAQEARKHLLAQHKEVDATVYVEPEQDDCTCPTCKQSLPEEQVKAAQLAAKEAFNLNRSTKLDEIVKKGAAQKARIVEMQQKISVLTHELQKLNEQLQTAQAELAPHQKALEKVQQQLEVAKTSVPDIAQDQQYQDLLAKKQEIADDLASLKEHAMTVAVDLETQIQALIEQKRVIEATVAQVANVSVIQKRIAELEEKQLSLVTELEKLERIEHLINLFERTKVRMLDERINSKFKLARFKLFHEQQNNGLKETCETTYDGVPYSDLNSAQKINIGIDICNTLQQHYGVVPVIFIDNRESITQLLETAAQTISLVVSAQDKKLRVSIDESEVLPTLNMEVI